MNRPACGSGLEELLLLHIRAAGLELPEAQYRFAPPRRWRLDFAWPEYMLAVEVEGGLWTRGRHQRPAGFLKDCEKYNRAALMGWRVLRVAEPHISSGDAIEWITAALRNGPRHDKTDPAARTRFSANEPCWDAPQGKTRIRTRSERTGNPSAQAMHKERRR